MASRTLPGLGLKAFWALGEDLWKDENDTNLLVLSALVQPRVLDIVSADPGAPADGDIYYFDGAHPTQAHKLAIRDNGVWVYIAAFEGMEFWNVADDTKHRFDGANIVEVGGGSGDGLHVAPTAVAAASLTLALTDRGAYLRLTSACAVTVPPNSSVAFPIGSVVTMRQASAGACSLVAGAGVTLNPPGGASGSLNFAEEGATVQIKKIATDTWDIIGGTAAA